MLGHQIWGQIQYNRCMRTQTSFSGIYAAAITPIHEDGSLDLESLPVYLDFLANRGCHGALILGTTGEGPSFSTDERDAILKAGINVQNSQQDFFLFAGTGTPSLHETIHLTKTAFDIGYQGVVVLPPYYFKSVSDDGLFSWFSALIQQAVPEQGALFIYHIPAVSGVAISLELLSRLKSKFPDQLVGIKDSSGDPIYGSKLVKKFRNDLTILTGNDRFITETLNRGGSGCITALANTLSPVIRKLWDAFHHAEDTTLFQEYLIQARTVAEKHGPFPPLIKALLPLQHNLPTWSVRPPLTPFSKDQANKLLRDINSINYEAIN